MSISMPRDLTVWTELNVIHKGCPVRLVPRAPWVGVGRDGARRKDEADWWIKPN